MGNGIGKSFRKFVLLFLSLTVSMVMITGCGFETSELGQIGHEVSEIVNDMLSDGEETQQKESETADNTKQEEHALQLNSGIAYYYYKHLSNTEKVQYRKLLKAYKKHRSTVTLELDSADMVRMESMVNADHPELFWVVSGSYSYVDYGTSVKMTLKYNRTAKKMKADRKKLNKALKKMLKNAPAQGTAYEKVKYVYEYLIKKLDYKKGVKDNQNVYSAIVRKKTVCAGYAKATQLLLQRLGVQSIYVEGYALGESHAWTIVRCNKKYYNVDTTWGDPTYTNKSSMEGVPVSLQIDYSYLCVNDSDLSRTHVADQSLEAPVCTASDKEYYRLNKLYFKKYGKNVKKSIRAAIKKGKKTWQGRFADKEAYESALEAVEDNVYGKLLNEYGVDWDKSWYLSDEDRLILKLYYT